MIRCLDEDTMSSELIGTIILRLDELAGNKEVTEPPHADENTENKNTEKVKKAKSKKDRTWGWMAWHSVLGGPVGGNDEAKLMDEQPELASEWKGRVLLNISLEKAEQPIKKIGKMNEEIRTEA